MPVQPKNRRARRAGLVAGSLAAAAVATVATGPPAAAEVQSKTRTDAFTFTVTGSTTQVTCDITSTLEYDTELQRVTAKTEVTGPVERPECRGSYPEVIVTESDGTSHQARGYGGIVSITSGPVEGTLRSAHFVHFQSCSCNSPTRNQSLPK